MNSCAVFASIIDVLCAVSDVNGVVRNLNITFNFSACILGVKVKDNAIGVHLPASINLSCGTCGSEVIN